MANSRQEELLTQGNFFRYYYNTAITLLIVTILLLIVMMSVVLYQIYHRPLPSFHAIAPNKKMMTLTAFDEPNLLPATLTRWARKAAALAYTFDFVNYNKQFETVRPFFTTTGWLGYQNSVAGLIGTIRQNQLFVNGVVSGTPVISNQGDYPGKGYTWRMQLPFSVTYQSAENATRRNFLVSLTIVRVSTRIDPTGIGIDQFVMS